MKKSALKWFMLIMALLFVSALAVGCGKSASNQSADDSDTIQVIRVAHMPEFEAFLTFKAIEDGLDIKNGIKLEMQYYDSGMTMIEALPANQWDFGAVGTLPATLAAMRYDSEMIAITDNESQANIVMARPDNPVFQNKGVNSKYPEIYGSPEQVLGKTILTTTVSTVHNATSSYLNALGLKDNDVNIMNLDQAQAVAAFDSGKGDFVGLWAPFCWIGLDKGWKVVSAGDQSGAKIMQVLIVNKKFAEEHPDLVVKFLDIYFQEIDLMKKEGPQLADEYQAFLRDWGGMDISKEHAILDIQKHPVFDLQEQLALFDKSKGQSQIEKFSKDITDFFVEQGRFTAAENDKTFQSGFITDKYLKMLAKEKGLTQ